MISQNRKYTTALLFVDKEKYNIAKKSNNNLNIEEYYNRSDIIKNISDYVKNINKDLDGDIVFDQVSFVYPDSGIKALKEVSFNVKKGQTLAVIGTTGSGKSTIANLLTRFYDVNEGSIKIDGIDIRDITKKSLRNLQEFGTKHQKINSFS